MDEDTSFSVYEGFLPLWDRKRLLEEEAWIFDKGMRDVESLGWDEMIKANKRREVARKRELQLLLARNVTHNYPTSSTKKRKVNHGKDELDDATIMLHKHNVMTEDNKPSHDCSRMT